MVRGLALHRGGGPADWIVIAAGAASAVFGLLILVGRSYGVDAPPRLAPGLAAIDAATALALTASGAALLLLRHRARSPVRVAVARGVAGVVGVFGLFLIGGWLSGAVGIHTSISRGGGHLAGHPSPHTALALVLVGGSLYAAAHDDERWIRAHQVLAGLLGLWVLAAVMGYGFGVEHLRGEARASALGVCTLFTLALLWAGLSWLHPDRGLPRVLAGDRPSAVLLRRLAPPAVLVPFVIGVLALHEEEAGLYGLKVGVALLTLAMIVGFVLALLTVGRALDVGDARHREAEARFRALVESAPDAMVIVDQAGVIVLVNAQTEALLGYHRGELLGRKVEMLVPERLRAQHLGHRNSFIAEPWPRPIGGGSDLSALCKDGSELPVDISLSPLRTGGRLLVCAAIRDSSKRRHAEEAMQQRDRLTMTLLRSVAHDFRSPLTAIATAAEASMLPTLHDETRRELAGIIVGEATRLSHVVGKLLDLSRLQGGSAAPQRVVCSSETIIASALEQIRADEETFRLVLDPDLPDVWVDPAQLERAFVNLFENARRFASAGPVHVRVVAHDGRVVVQVADDGPGIPPAEREHVFEPFIRIAPDRAGGGSGLGLAIARGFAEANGARISVEPLPPGRGTTFVVELPVDPFQPALEGRRR